MAPSPPTESQILHSYLLHPSPLSTILPYKTFLTLLPKSSSSLQSTHAPALKHLYRDLEFQRDVTIDDVRRRIENECTRSVRLTARLSRQIKREEGARRQRKRKHSTREGDEDGNQISSDGDAEDEGREMHFDTVLHDGVPLSNTLPQKTSQHNHNTASLLSAMESATRDLHSEIEDLETEIESLHSECAGVVSGLSDLRYGRSGGARGSGISSVGTDGGVEDAVIAALDDLKQKLEEKGAG